MFHLFGCFRHLLAPVVAGSAQREPMNA
jgi:hypothetical protein